MSFPMKYGEWDVLVSLKNDKHQFYFGISKEEYDYIFLSSPFNVSQRIREFLACV